MRHGKIFLTALSVAAGLSATAATNDLVLKTNKVGAPIPVSYTHLTLPTILRV